MAKKLLFPVLFWGAILVVLIATLSPLDTIKPITNIGWEYTDKLVHVFLFIVLTILCYWAYPKFDRIISLGILVGYGLLIEVLQHVLPVARGFEWLDWLCDILGVIIGFGISYKTNYALRFKHAILKCYLFK